jgi:hypothetical protein
MPTLDLTDEERDALAAYLRAGIAADRFPLSPRLRPIKAVLAKLEPPKVVKQPPPLVGGPEIAISARKSRTRRRT